MRIWILEDTPEYEQSTFHGAYDTPGHAWDDLFGQVQRKVFEAHVDDLTMYVGADPMDDAQDGTRAVLLNVRYRNSDEITLTGVQVKGTTVGAPTLGEWRDLQQVAGLLRMHAVNSAGYRCADEQPNNRAIGTWNFRRED